MDKNQKMTDLDEAIQRILAEIKVMKDTEVVSLSQACGRVLAQDVVSHLSVPAFDNSAMDGYAVHCADFCKNDVALHEDGGRKYVVSQRIPAGHQGVLLERGTVARIFTGAPIPQGADVVIQQEHVQVLDDGHIVFTHWHEQGDNIRRAGEDIQKGDVVISQGKRLGVADIGLAASIGQAQFIVYRRPKVALFVTGDELTEPGQALKPGGIYNSNQYVLCELLRECGCEVVEQGVIRDTLEAVSERLAQAAKSCDLILSSGGVSVGEEDHVKNAVQKLGELKLWKLAFKPGKPLAFGRINGVDGAWFLGLPGNPVASFVTFLTVVRPFLQKLSGQVVSFPQAVHVPANFVIKTKGRREFLRARLNEIGQADLYPNQSSGVLTSMAWGKGFVDVPAHMQVEKGDLVRYIPFTYFLEN